MITKIGTHKIEHQSSTKIFVWDCDNSKKANQNKLWRAIQNQPNVEVWNYNKKAKRFNQKKKNGRWIFFFKKRKGQIQLINLKIYWPNSLTNPSLKLTRVEVVLTWSN